MRKYGERSFEFIEKLRRWGSMRLVRAVRILPVVVLQSAERPAFGQSGRSQLANDAVQDVPAELQLFCYLSHHHFSLDECTGGPGGRSLNAFQHAAILECIDAMRGQRS